MIKKVPQNVIDFAKENGRDCVSYEKKWNGYEVYSFWNKMYEGLPVGLPLFILVKDGKLTVSTKEQRDAILRSMPN